MLLDLSGESRSDQPSAWTAIAGLETGVVSPQMVQQAMARLGPLYKADAHRAEDALWQRVLLAIAEGRCVNVAACAEAALRSRTLAFDRWYE